MVTRHANNRWIRAWRRIGLLAALWLLACAASAAQVLVLDPARAKVTLDTQGDDWIDRSGRADIQAVDGGAALPWRPTREGRVYPLRSQLPLWIRFTLAKKDNTERWYLEVPYAGVNRVTLYTPDHAGGWTAQAAGDELPVSTWPVPHRHPLLPLALSPGQAQPFYVRIDNPHSFGAPLVFTSERQLLRQEQRTGLVLGIYFGLGSLAVVLALLGAVWLRDAAFVWYAATVVLISISQAALTGVAGLHLWPHWAGWNDRSGLVLPLVAAWALLWFLSTAVSLPERSRRLHRLLVLLSLLCLAAAAAVVAVEPSWRYRVMAPSLVLALLVGIAVLVWAARHGDRLAGWLLACMAPLLLGSAFPLARLLGLIPVSFATTHAMLLALVIELPLLLAVLLMRSQDRRENSRRLHRLQRIDPATGLINHEVFMERLDRLIGRCSRLRQQGLVLLVDIVNIEQIRRKFDRRSAEEMPLRVAARLLSSAREIDSVARLAEHRFGLLVEGPVSAEEAAAAGSKVVARCLMPFEGKPVDWVAQVRVAQALVPGRRDARELLARLEALLAAAPAYSKRAVYTLK